MMFRRIHTGLYERIIYWCISSANFVEEDILCNKNLSSIEILYLIRFLIGHRVYEFTDEACAYLKPILNRLRKNEQQPEIQTKPRIDNKREEALERRSADIVERWAFSLQQNFDTFKVLQDMIEDKDGTTDNNKICFENITKSTRIRIMETIKKLFYDNHDIDKTTNIVNNSVNKWNLDTVPITSIKQRPKESMKIELYTCKIAVKMYDALFFPQSLHLFNCDLTTDEIGQQIYNTEKTILELNYNVFCVQQIDGNNGPLHHAERRGINVKDLLKNLIEKKLLRQGMYLKTAARNILSYMCIFDFADEDELNDVKRTLMDHYGWTLEHYIKRCFQNKDYPIKMGKTIQPTVLGQQDLAIQKQSMRNTSETLTQNKQYQSSTGILIVITAVFVTIS
ncbi:unnamed protein product [Didymodactylos carnosus]|uniref:Uncharacterized protein n=1 Tax=Didymodactylos carnosus TaxID=1234261 RepID=A0A815VUY5_9BILA|nr:unnamed protein product [Didymodactylos carnosus]CAF4393119.1 unnamed protein product [Didymodactylos carnosus]